MVDPSSQCNIILLEASCKNNTSSSPTLPSKDTAARRQSPSITPDSEMLVTSPRLLTRQHLDIELVEDTESSRNDSEQEPLRNGSRQLDPLRIGSGGLESSRSKYGYEYVDPTQEEDPIVRRMLMLNVDASSQRNGSLSIMQ